MRITWLLQEELALGTAPGSHADLDRLEQEGVKAVLSLCAPDEADLPAELSDRFAWSRLPLPNHCHVRAPSLDELAEVVAELARLRRHGPVYLHCVAAVERSPLVAMAWLIHTNRLSWQAALEYVQQVHPGTSPLPEHLAVLRFVSRIPQPLQPVLPAVA